MSVARTVIKCETKHHNLKTFVGVEV